MWKKRILCLVLVLCAFLLAACQQEKVIYPTQERPETQQPAAQEGCCTACGSAWKNCFRPLCVAQ